MGKFIDLTGNKVGRLTIVKLAGKGGGELIWECLCECGNLTKAFGNNLRSSHTKSCGCLTKKHGNRPKSGSSPEYRAWRGLRNRCNNPNDKDYKYYGGKGIKVCERWNEFSNFLNDMGKKPSRKHSIDRIDCNGDYGPTNCKWSTITEQNRNRENVKLLTYGDKTCCIPEWAEITGFTINVIHKRLHAGWDIHKTLTLKPFKGNKSK